MPRRRLLGQPNQTVKQLAVILGWLSLLFVVTDVGSTQGNPDAPGESPRCLTITMLPGNIALTVCSAHPMPVPASGDSGITSEPEQ
jgi:hypothetical protein